MPHAIYLHSAHDDRPRAGAQRRRQRRRLLRFSNIEVVIALGFAGLVNMAMVAMAATMFHQGHADVGEIETAYHTLLPLMGVVAAGAFMASLLASGRVQFGGRHDGGPGRSCRISSASGSRCGCGAR